MAEGTIPIVDFSGFSVDISKKDVDPNVLKCIATKIYKAFSEIGFVYILNHGINAELVNMDKDI